MSEIEAKQFDCAIGNDQVSLLAFRSGANSVSVASPDFPTNGFSIAFQFSPVLLVTENIDALLEKAKLAFVEAQWPQRIAEYKQQGALPQQFMDTLPAA